MTKKIKKVKKEKKPIPCLDEFDCSRLADKAKNLNEAFLKKGFTSEQSFQLTTMILKLYLG